MVRVKYPARIIVDKGFIEWLIENDKTAFLKLTHIKSSSMDHKGSHNIMLDDDIQDIASNSKIREGNLRAAFKGLAIPKEISDVLSERVDQMIVLAIILATEKPYKTYILTTKQLLDSYKQSTHYQNLKSISVKSGEDALSIIESLWKQFKEERNLYR